jgi:hypothetical protein
MDSSYVAVPSVVVELSALEALFCPLWLINDSTWCLPVTRPRFVRVMQGQWLPHLSLPRSACSQELRDKLAARSTELHFSAVTFYGKYCPQMLCLTVSSTLNNGCSRYLLATWLLNL